MRDQTAEFWKNVDLLMSTSKVIVDRSRGSSHPHYSDRVYPVDYGYLAGTKAADGGGIDIWIGSGGIGPVQGLFCSLDLNKRDAEIKLYCGCSVDELQVIETFMNQQAMRVIRVERGV